MIASGTRAEQERFLNDLTEPELAALPFLFDFWALPHQLPPPGDWRTWVIIGGRGAGKTRAGAEWVRSLAEGPKPHVQGRASRIALVGETIDQTREVMIFGDSGILSLSPPDSRPEWIAGRRILLWPNGATAQVFSATNYEALRGPQFDAVWADELAKWRNGDKAWDMLQFGLRLGENPQACVTTTPRGGGLLKDLLARDSTVHTHANTYANAANLAPGFLTEITRRYAGTRLGRQELEGVILNDAEGALWRNTQLADLALSRVPELTRIVVAVDPPASGHGKSDDCGIVVAGVVAEGPPQDWQGYVLEDATISAAQPMDWARAVADAYRRHGAERVVAEVNQGGDMVAAVLRSADAMLPVRSVRASRGKVVRAEPVAALYEQGRVQHLRGMGQLEDQMCLMTTQGFSGSGSPDRVDALVWALYDLMIAPMQRWAAPQVRGL